MDWKPMLNEFGRTSDHYMLHPVIWVQRMEWPEPQKVPRGSLHPQTNAVGLHWRPAIDGEFPNLHTWARQMDWMQRALTSHTDTPKET